MDRFFVVTGGPGSGKSTLLDAVAGCGIACMEEGGRAVIRSQLENRGTALPWADREAFAEKMTEHDRQNYRAAQALNGVVLFDRGIPDVIGYRELCGLSCPVDLIDAARSLRYNTDVFIAPPWRDIYQKDAERKQDWDEAVATHDVMGKTYGALGYRLVQLPCILPDQRAAFVIDHCFRSMRSGSI